MFILDTYLEALIKSVLIYLSHADSRSGKNLIIKLILYRFLKLICLG